MSFNSVCFQLLNMSQKIVLSIFGGEEKPAIWCHVHRSVFNRWNAMKPPGVVRYKSIKSAPGLSPCVSLSLLQKCISLL